VRALTLLIVCALTGAMASTASARTRSHAARAVARSAYVLDGNPWHKRVIRYRSRLSGTDRWSLRVAVAAWNASGVRIRFAPTHGNRPDLRIGYSPMPPGAAAEATTGYVAPRAGVLTPSGGHARGAHVWMAPLHRRSFNDPQINAVALAHELGHVLGLAHVRNKCAAMSYQHDQLCPPLPSPWIYRCRLLERDDLAGAARMYGTRRGGLRLSTEFCERGPAPPLVTDLAGGLQPGGAYLTWTTPPGSAKQVLIEQRVCAPDIAGDWYLRAVAPAQPGPQRWDDTVFPGYLLCYRVRTQDPWGRDSGPSPEIALAGAGP
jgi:hypothetical protein